jgi:carbamoylphosphate synthase large subunit
VCNIDNNNSGAIREKEAAKKEYTAAVREKKQAALVEQEKPDTFVCTIGNIKPGERLVHLNHIKSHTQRRIT